MTAPEALKVLEKCVLNSGDSKVFESMEFLKGFISKIVKNISPEGNPIPVEIQSAEKSQ